ncbi:hypothetical protein DUNSADRAFT_7737, partial [Dunaliella salina]
QIQAAVELYSACHLLMVSPPLLPAPHSATTLLSKPDSPAPRPATSPQSTPSGASAAAPLSVHPQSLTAPSLHPHSTLIGPSSASHHTLIAPSSFHPQPQKLAPSCAPSMCSLEHTIAALGHTSPPPASIGAIHPAADIPLESRAGVDAPAHCPAETREAANTPARVPNKGRVGTAHVEGKASTNIPVSPVAGTHTHMWRLPGCDGLDPLSPAAAEQRLAGLRIYRAVEEAEVVAERWLTATREGSRAEGAGAAAHAAKSEMARSVPTMVRLAFPAEHTHCSLGPTPAAAAPAAALTAAAAVATRNGMPAAAMANGREGVAGAAATSAAGEGVGAKAVPAAAAAAAPGSERLHTKEPLPTAAVPAALSRRARAVLGYAALAVHNAVLLAVCRWVWWRTA